MMSQTKLGKVKKPHNLIVSIPTVIKEFLGGTPPSVKIRVNRDMTNREFCHVPDCVNIFWVGRTFSDRRNQGRVILMTQNLYGSHGEKYRATLSLTKAKRLIA